LKWLEKLFKRRIKDDTTRPIDKSYEVRYLRERVIPDIRTYYTIIGSVDELLSLLDQFCKREKFYLEEIVPLEYARLQQMAPNVFLPPDQRRDL
jgi:hypothetical protein